MKSGFTVTGKDKVMRGIYQEMLNIRRIILRNMNYIGYEVVNYLRSLPADESFIDDTGNLRSSIGYVLVESGEIVSQGGFDTIKHAFEGSIIGQSFAESIAKNTQGDFVLVVVAGMSYATYVENMENKSVLAKGIPVLESKISAMKKKITAMMKQK